MEINRCDKCNALCCKYLCFEIDEPEDYDDFEDIRWYLCHEGISVHVDDDEDWYIQIDMRCKCLDENNQCTIYDDRPLICRKYGEDCELTGDDYGYLQEFKSPEELEDYARKTLGQDEYEYEMIKFRAKSEGVSREVMQDQLMARGILQALGKRK